MSDAGRDPGSGPLDLPTLALTSGGLGFLRPAPGTWGSLPPVVIVAGLVAAGLATPALNAVAGLLLLFSAAACVVWGPYGERRFGRKDASEVVADETAGVCLPVMVAVSSYAEPSERYLALVAAFLLFRFFDILKPWPLKRLERLPHGWGVLMDDIMAGVYAAATLAIGGGFL